MDRARRARAGDAQGDLADGVVERLQDLPLGGLLLVGATVGFIGLGLFRLAEAGFDLDRRGSDWPARVQRIGRAAGGLDYLALAWFAAQLLWSGSGDAPSVQPAATGVRAAPGGGLLMITGGLVVLGVAVGQWTFAFTARFMASMSRATPRWAIWLGRAGYAARGAVFAVVGWSILRFGLGGHHLRDWRQGLAAIARHPSLFVPVALGLALFGAFSLLEARYRNFPDDAEVKREVRHALPG